MIPSQGPLTGSRDGQEGRDPPSVFRKRRKMQALVWLRDSEVQVIRSGPSEGSACPLGFLAGSA